MKVDKKDWLKALQYWYGVLDEYNDLEEKDFNYILKKYNITVEDIMKI
jgi:hypothetical protein